ncbi:hypothetical protein ACFP81_14050 [Deinococcus lacus]|uniref:DUF1963 domain-containing protein n=1 Tax=Deinococcus lacus TaxID=392561 RepID=A0ABW1YIR7_9DEIO
MSRQYVSLQAEQTPHSIGQFGGPCPLPQGVMWPRSRDGRPLSHVLTLWGSALAGAGQPAPVTAQVSVFAPSFAGEYVLDSLCYHGDPQEKRDLETAVIGHAGDGPARSEGDLLPLQFLTLGAEETGAERTGSWLGEPELLQREPLDLPGLYPALQLSGYELPTGCDVLDAPADRGYLYLYAGQPGGLFFVQTT